MTPLDFSIHPAAIEEAVQAARWYRERSPIATARFIEELNLVIDAIVEAPQRWPRGITPTRRVKLPFFPFLVIYVETDVYVRILAVAHGRRRPGYWKGRL